MISSGLHYFYKLTKQSLNVRCPDGILRVNIPDKILGPSARIIHHPLDQPFGAIETRRTIAEIVVEGYKTGKTISGDFFNELPIGSNDYGVGVQLRANRFGRRHPLIVQENPAHVRPPRS